MNGKSHFLINFIVPIYLIFILEYIQLDRLMPV